MLTFPREEIPANWREWCDEATDNFRVINPKGFRMAHPVFRGDGLWFM